MAALCVNEFRLVVHDPGDKLYMIVIHLEDCRSQIEKDLTRTNILALKLCNLNANLTMSLQCKV